MKLQANQIISAPFNKAIFLAVALLITSSSWAQNIQPAIKFTGKLPNRGVDIGGPQTLDAANKLTDTSCPTCGTVLRNRVSCTGGRAYKSSTKSCVCPTGTWNGITCLASPTPTPSPSPAPSVPDCGLVVLVGSYLGPSFACKVSGSCRDLIEQLWFPTVVSNPDGTYSCGGSMGESRGHGPICESCVN